MLTFKQIRHPSGKLLIHRAETGSHEVEVYSVEQAATARLAGTWFMTIKVAGAILRTHSQHRTLGEARELAERVLSLVSGASHAELLEAFALAEAGAPVEQLETVETAAPRAEVAEPVVVIACTQQKLPHRAPAVELYTSPNFRLMLRAARKIAGEQSGRVVILSALHGLVELEQELDPYDLSMRQAGAIAPAIVAEQLRRINPGPITALLPSKYAACLDKAAELAGLPEPVELLADALGIGFQRGVASAILNSQKGNTRMSAQNYQRIEDTTDSDGFVVPGYSRWDCEKCGQEVRRYRGESDVDCNNCGACYNAGGQRLRDDWRGNPSNYDDEIGDLEGFELQQLRAEQ